MGFDALENPETRRNRPILALGFNPDDPFFVPGALPAEARALKQKGRILFDQLSRPEFGPIADWFRDGRTVETEIAGNRVRVAGLVSLGTSFGADGNLVTSSETFLDLQPGKPAGAIQVGLIRLKAGSDPELVRQRLEQRLPSDVSVFTKQGFIDFEQNYWRTSTSIGFIFTLGAAMGFVVGCVIVYQVLYTDVSEHLPEYATLMAMGYRISHLLGVVIREGFYLAVMGYLPAYAAGQALYWFVQDATRLPVGMNAIRATTVFSDDPGDVHAVIAAGDASPGGCGSRRDLLMLDAAVHIQGLSHSFGRGAMKREVLKDIALSIAPGGSGVTDRAIRLWQDHSSTLIGALRTVQVGSVEVLGQRLDGAGRRQRQQLRRRIGMIFQGHNLLRCLTAEQNVQMGSDLLPNLSYCAGAVIRPESGCDRWAWRIIWAAFPHDLSGGQKQRVAIARALAAKPNLLLADEPTAALDSVTGREVVELLRRLAREQSCAVLMVTHDPRIVDVADRLLQMEDGSVLQAVQ